MDKFCRISSNEKQYDEYHKLYKRSNKSNVKCFLKYYYANRDKEMEKRKKMF